MSGLLLRVRDEDEARVTPLELFFDLVYVFAITQLSHLLLDRPTLGGALQTLFLLLVVWWAWHYASWFTNWFDSDALPPLSCSGERPGADVNACPTKARSR